MRYLLLFIVSTLVLPGCLNKKSIIKTKVSGIAPDELQANCSEINEIGNIWLLIKKINQKTEQAITLAQAGSPLEVLPKISRLEAEVSDLVERVVQLATPEWTEKLILVHAAWKIGPKELGYEEDHGLVITKVRVKYFSLNGKKVVPENVTITIGTNGLTSTITNSREANFLELCAFQSTLSILIDVEYSLPYNSESPMTQGGHKLFLLGIK